METFCEHMFFFCKVLRIDSFLGTIKTETQTHMTKSTANLKNWKENGQSAPSAAKRAYAKSRLALLLFLIG